mmetsp:Transcript_44636/g.72680  ORF Transcript_44636/g.72680 Transcript_44636/m.72680 type:complete len:182 (-) Transcript_44636:243-788(-)|eukprot:CAMPEP_0184670694 /NCGR_PEP_ID=MMETSP0308-20130426/83385_1 /TAXON_ID=38269 /ORGANISM="Gloeochaete witrockiana, Strain SAG 46.84" /LENGTH=181 /DNA_ID=CAMNT_0027117539 /DNA_START=169 /DNA_END=714 /DNA_ORIENTATION=-
MPPSTPTNHSKNDFRPNSAPDQTIASGRTSPVKKTCIGEHVLPRRHTIDSPISINVEDIWGGEFVLEEDMEEEDDKALYKTELCRSFLESGTCRYGSKCQFAHGIKELRTVVRHPKFKTELCKTFHSDKGKICPYGSRCRFIHARKAYDDPNGWIDGSFGNPNKPRLPVFERMTEHRRHSA